MKENIWKKNKIPVLEFCTIDTAAKLLNMSREELLNLSRMGAIKTYIYLDDARVGARILYNKDNVKLIADTIRNMGIHGVRPRGVGIETPFNEYTILVQPSDMYHMERRIIFSAYWIDNLDEFLREVDEYFSQDEQKENILFPMRARLYMSGYIPFSPDNIKKHGMSRIETLDLYVQLFDSYEGDIYISSCDVEKISNSIGKTLDVDIFSNNQLTTNNIETTVAHHGNVERFARRREDIIMTALYVGQEHSDDCNGRRGERTIDAWAQATINHWTVASGGFPEPSLDTVRSIISDMGKSPEERRVAGLPRK